MASRPTCPFCGTSVSAEARYCDHCGTPLAHAKNPTPRRFRGRPAGHVAVWVFVLVLSMVFGTGMLGGFRYQAGYWPLLAPSPVVSATTDMTGVSIVQPVPDTTAEQYLRAVVSIDVRGSRGNKFGSGFVMTNSGHVVTAAHVVQGATCVTVMDNNGRLHQGTVVASKPALDVALVSVPGLKDWPAHLELGQSQQLREMDDVLVLGNPKGHGSVVPLSGAVSKLHDQQTIDGQYFGNLIQVGGATVMEGTSGGPLVAKRTGRVVGVVIAGSNAPVSWAVPSEELSALLAEWIALPVSTSCASVPAARTTPVYLATITPLSGASGIDGDDLANGAHLAIRDLEESLRAVGYEVSLKRFDDQGSPAVAREMAETAAYNPGVIGVIGSLNSPVTYSVAEALKTSGLVMVAPTAGAEELVGKGWPHFNRLVANSQRQEQAAARFVKNRLGTNQVFVVTDGTPEAARQVSVFEWAAQVIEVTVFGRVRLAADTSYPDLAQQIRESGAGAVYYAGASGQALDLVKGLRQNGVALPVIGGGSLFDTRFHTLTDPVYQGIYFTRLTAEPSQTFQKHFESTLGKPTRGYAAYSYDAASVILTALIRYGEQHPGQVPPRTELARMVRELKGHPGRTAWITFDQETGENKTSWVHVYEWKQGVPELRENLQ